MKCGKLEDYSPPYKNDVILCLLVDSIGGRSHAVSLSGMVGFLTQIVDMTSHLERNLWTGVALMNQ